MPARPARHLQAALALGLLATIGSGRTAATSPPTSRLDGTKLAFIRDQPAPPKTRQEDRTQQFALYVMNVNGTGLRQVVPYGGVQGHEIQAAHWSPDGKLLITANKNGRIFTVPAAGGSIKVIKTGVDGFAYEPNWSPDGKRIIFGVFGPTQPDLYTANPDGTHVTQISSSPDFENGPDWR